MPLPLWPARLCDPLGEVDQGAAAVAFHDGPRAAQKHLESQGRRRIGRRDEAQVSAAPERRRVDGGAGRAPLGERDDRAAHGSTSSWPVAIAAPGRWLARSMLSTAARGSDEG